MKYVLKTCIILLYLLAASAQPPTTICRANCLSCSAANNCNVGGCATTPNGVFNEVTGTAQGSCVLTCNAGYYTVDGAAVGATCIACGNNCASCSSATACGTCDANPSYGAFAAVADENRCRLTCNDAFYVTGGGDGTADLATCTACGNNCASCSSATACETCDANPSNGAFAAVAGENSCRLTCNAAFFVTGGGDGTADGATCTGCGANCVACTSAAVCTTCVTPSNGIATNDLDGTCTVTCNSGFVTTDGTLTGSTCTGVTNGPPYGIGKGQGNGPRHEDTNNGPGYGPPSVIPGRSASKGGGVSDVAKGAGNSASVASAGTSRGAGSNTFRGVILGSAICVAIGFSVFRRRRGETNTDLEIPSTEEDRNFSLEDFEVPSLEDVEDTEVIIT